MSSKTKQQRLIVGKNEEKLLAIEIDIQKNHFKLNLKKLTKVDLEKVLADYNNMDWVDKLTTLSEYYNLSIDNKDSEIMELRFKSFIAKEFRSLVNSLNKNNFYHIEEEFSNNILSYKGSSIYLVDWLNSLANKIIDVSIIEAISDIISKIKTIEITDKKFNYKNKYYLYMGKKDSYKGCIGELIKIKDNSKTPYLICFYGKKSEQSSGKLWCSKSNLTSIF